RPTASRRSWRLRPVGQRRKSLSCYRLIPTPCVYSS
ncbi:MAG: Mobile element protein, partial [Olavius algarvensis Gamma 1 endosymbiont]